MNKLVSILSLASLFSMSSAVIADPITVYGKANVSLQSTDDGDGNFTETKSNASRFGAKGELELDGGMEAFYKFEWQVDLADNSGSDNIKSRNQFVGLRGDFGEVAIGRNDTVFKQSQGKIDLFNDYEADLKVLWKGENRMSDSLTYKSPKFNNFQLGVTYVTEDEKDGEDATSVALTYGDKTLKKSALYASVAIDSEMKGYDAVRATVQAKFDKLKLGLMLQEQEEVATGTDKSGFMVNAAYSIGKATLKAQHQDLEDDSMTSVGIDYKLGKKTKGFIWYSSHDKDASDDKSWLALGLEHKF